jgi:Transcriptional regulators
VTEQAPVWHYEHGPIGRLMKVGYILLRREMQDLLKASGLTHTQWSALGVLLHSPGITSSELEHILMIERPSVTSLMNGLEKRGLIEKRNDPKDGRSKQIFLTDAGLKLAEQTQHFGMEVEQRVKKAMADEDLEMLKKYLLKMIRALEK